MGKVLKTVLIIVGVLIVLGAMLVSPYNKMVQKDLPTSYGSDPQLGEDCSGCR